MGKTYDSITPTLQDWIKNQHIFFVSTAPLSADGHINCSPKGLDTFRVLDEHTVAYLDLTGSGVETISHVKENGRMTIMFCAFEGAPKILRLYGNGEIVEPGSEKFEPLRSQFPDNPGTRAIIILHCTRIMDSCGYAVPEMTFQKERDVLDKWFDRKGEDGLVTYRKGNNDQSLDGLPGLKN